MSTRELGQYDFLDTVSNDGLVLVDWWGPAARRRDETYESTSRSANAADGPGSTARRREI